MNGYELCAALVDLLYPWPMRCISCEEEDPIAGGVFCPACLAALASGAPERVCTDEAVSMSVSAHPYAGQAGVLVRALKYRGMASLAGPMGDEIYAALTQYKIAPPERVTFVPMHRARRMKKMFDQSELIARAVCANLNVRPEKLLKRTRHCRQQSGFASFAARVQNVEDAFGATQRLDGARILLVDDVYTTGATARACAKALKEAGAREVIVAVYARGGGNIKA